MVVPARQALTVPVTRHAALSLLTVACLVSCGSWGPSPRFDETHWARLGTSGIPADRLTELQGGAGWDHGFVLAGSHWVPTEPNRDVLDLYISGDGRRWRPVSLNGLLKFSDSPASGYRGSAYVLGSGVSSAALWTTHDGTTWKAAPLPGSELGAAPIAVAAGPRGVVVIGSGSMSDTVTGGGGLRIWHSANGMSFGLPRRVVVPLVSSGEFVPQVSATADGFLIYGTTRLSGESMLLTSSDGVGWRNTAGGVTGTVETLVQNAGTSVTFTYGKLADGGPTVWRRKKGSTRWSSSKDISVGRLPDANVAPPEEQSISDVAAWQDGFVASGSSSGGGALWLSADGVTWSRVPVKANGFEATGHLTVLTNRAAALAVGYGSFDNLINIWRGTT